MNKKYKNGISGRYKTPLDNLIFAILAQAAVDSILKLFGEYSPDNSTG